MRSLRWSALLCALLCGSGALADDAVLPPLRVTPPGEADASTDASSGGISQRGVLGLSNLLSVGLCLAGAIWVWRGRVREAIDEDGELWSVISQRPLDARHRLMVVRFADSLLLLSVSQNQISLLKEIDDPAQVAEVNLRVSAQREIASGSLRKKLAALGFLRGMA